MKMELKISQENRSVADDRQEKESPAAFVCIIISIISSDIFLSADGVRSFSPMRSEVKVFLLAYITPCQDQTTSFIPFF
jgi:hypothetical protein